MTSVQQLSDEARAVLREGDLVAFEEKIIQLSRSLEHVAQLVPFVQLILECGTLSSPERVHDTIEDYLGAFAANLESKINNEAERYGGMKDVGLVALALYHAVFYE